MGCETTYRQSAAGEQEQVLAKPAAEIWNLRSSTLLGALQTSQLHPECLDIRDTSLDQLAAAR